MRFANRNTLPISPMSLLLSVAAYIVVQVNGHGLLYEPESRNYVARIEGSDNPVVGVPLSEYCPHCLNRNPDFRFCGSVDGAVGNYDDWLDSAGQPMPWDSRAIYTQGTTISMKSNLWVHHGGHMEVKGCAMGSTPTQQCMDSHILMFVEDEYYGMPADPYYPERGYYYGGKGWDGQDFSMKFQLPNSLVGQHVLLQWRYITANSCTPPGYVDYFARNNLPEQFWSPEVESCPFPIPLDGDLSQGGPEQFFSCSEVTIWPNDGSPRITSAPVSRPPTDAPVAVPNTSNSDDTPAGPLNPLCRPCIYESVGDCQNKDGACFDYMDAANKLCWPGSFYCGDFTYPPTSNPTISPSPTTFETDPPSASPTHYPTDTPSSGPTYIPTGSPTAVPTETPSSGPTHIPTVSPTAMPTDKPSASPSAAPTGTPSSAPTGTPSSAPTFAPTAPTAAPTNVPTDTPTNAPSETPSSAPSGTPTAPTAAPTDTPTGIPTGTPTDKPSSAPSSSPTDRPSSTPSATPTDKPSQPPTAVPTAPTGAPTDAPSPFPSSAPVSAPTGPPTRSPTDSPTIPTTAPTIPVNPLCKPCANGSEGVCQTADGACSFYMDAPKRLCWPGAFYCGLVTLAPTDAPVQAPTDAPSVSPVKPPAAPTPAPSVAINPFCGLCANGSVGACQSAGRSCSGFMDPVEKTCWPGAFFCGDMTAALTDTPTINPTIQSTSTPTPSPTKTPTTSEPTMKPTVGSTGAPTSGPIRLRTAAPSTQPPVSGATSPTGQPVTSTPTMLPTVKPTNQPVTSNPTMRPTVRPTVKPTAKPTVRPTSQPVTPSPTISPTNSPETQAPKKPDCPPCFPGTSGDCQQADTICWTYADPATRTCHPGTIDCAAP